MTKLYVACITAAAAISAAPLAQGQQASGIGGGKILIGQSAPLSGSNAQLGIEIREGALAYFKKVNEAGGVYGRRIELVTLDDANDVSRAEANTRELVEKTGVFALFG